jgi:hypothetical protein
LTRVLGRVVLALALAATMTACGSHNAAPLGVNNCIAAWNGPDNARRERVGGVVAQAGYVHAVIQLTGRRAQPDPNQAGCRVVLFNHDRWMGFVAQPDRDRFRFRPAMLGREEGDQSGIWPYADLHSPYNVTMLEAAKLTLARWQKLMHDWADNGRIDDDYPCAAAREAVRHLPEDGPEIGAPVRAYERKIC